MLKCFNTLNTVCFMHGLSIYELKSICHSVQFLKSYMDFTASDRFSEQYRNYISRKEITVIFNQFVSSSIIAHDLKLLVNVQYNFLFQVSFA